jgi:Holliday junction resolvasome RuvABC DNA-binding subunit
VGIGKCPEGKQGKFGEKFGGVGRKVAERLAEKLVGGLAENQKRMGVLILRTRTYRKGHG